MNFKYLKYLNYLMGPKYLKHLKHLTCAFSQDGCHDVPGNADSFPFSDGAASRPV